MRLAEISIPRKPFPSGVPKGGGDHIGAWEPELRNWDHRGELAASRDAG